MNLLDWMTIGALALICTISTTLVLHRNYEDGLFGRIALAAAALASGVIVAEVLLGVEYHFLPTTSVVFLGLAVFQLRHLYRFWKWCQNCDVYGWRPSYSTEKRPSAVPPGDTQ